MLRRQSLFEEKYRKFLKQMRDAIISGEIKPGEFILPENTLTERFGLSRFSVRNALAELVQEGLIEKIPGKGNRVTVSDKARSVETVRLGWFSNSFEIPIVRELIESYERHHPYVKVELMVLPEDEYYAPCLAQMIELENGPDLFLMSDSHLRWMAENDKLGMLRPYQPSEWNTERDSYPKVFELFTLEGELQAVPFVFSPIVIGYNGTLLEQAGIDPGKLRLETWGDLLDVAKRCTTVNADGMPEIFGFCFSSAINRWPVFVMQNEGKLVRGGEFALSDERTMEALQFGVDLMYKHGVSPIYSHGSNYIAESLFAKGRVAMILTSYYFMNTFRGQPFRMMLLPAPGGRKQGTILMGSGLAINRASTKTKLAESLIDYMLGEEAQTLLKRRGCTIPVRREAAENDALLDPDVHPEPYNIFTQVLPHAKSLWELGLTMRQIELLQNELHLLWAGMEKPQEACARIDRSLSAR